MANSLAPEAFALLGVSCGLLGPAMHPFMDVTPKEAPVLSDFGRRELTNSCQLIDRGLGHPKKPCDLHDSENFSVPSVARLGLSRRFCRYITVHNE